MLSIAALLHILDNAAKDLHNSITDFDKCMTYTLAICSLLCNEGPGQSFLHRVVRGGGFDHHVGLFESTFPLHSEHVVVDKHDAVASAVERRLDRSLESNLSARMNPRMVRSRLM